MSDPNSFRPRFRPVLTPLESRDNPATGFTAFGAAPGGAPLVEVDRPDGTLLARFAAFDGQFTGGVRAATGELDGNPNTVEVVAAAGPGGGPRVQVFSVVVATGQVVKIADFFAFEPAFRDGLRVAVGQVTGGTGFTGISNLGSGIGSTGSIPQQIVIGADSGGGPRVSVFQLQNGTGVPVAGPLGNFFAFEPGFLGGVRVAAGDVDGNPANGDEIVVGAGPGGGPRVRVFRSDGAVIQDFFALPANTTTGVNVAVNPVSGQIITDGLPTDFSQRNSALNAAAGSNLVAFAAPATTTAIPGAAFGTTATGLGSLGTSGSTFGNTTTSGIGTTTGSTFGATTSIGVGTTSGPTFGNTTTTGFGTTSGLTFGTTGTGGFGTTTGTTFGTTGTGAFGTTSGTTFGTTGTFFSGPGTTTGGMFGTTTTSAGAFGTTGF